VFHGSLVALVTPFDGNNRVDYSSLKRLIDFHVEQGSSGLVIAGTSGESPTLRRSEHIELIGRSVEIAAGRNRFEFDVSIHRVIERRIGSKAGCLHGSRAVLQ